MATDEKKTRDIEFVDEAWLPSEYEVAEYEKNGWYIAPSIIPHSLLDATKLAIEAHQSGERDRKLLRSAKFSDWRPGEGDTIRNNEFCSLQNDGVRKLVMQPLLGAIAARLAGSSAIRLFDDQAIYKPQGKNEDGATAVGWHTDHSYWSTCTSNSMLTAWIPLQDTNEENGTLYVVDGSHKWPESEHLRGFNDPDLDSIEQRIGRNIPTDQITPMNLLKGQVSFHHMRALHASAPNRASNPRFAVAVHMQDNENRYQPFVAANGMTVVLPHDQLCRTDDTGQPDYSDPEVFPQIWPVKDLAGMHA